MALIKEQKSVDLNLIAEVVPGDVIFLELELPHPRQAVMPLIRMIDQGAITSTHRETLERVMRDNDWGSRQNRFVAVRAAKRFDPIQFRGLMDQLIERVVNIAFMKELVDLSLLYTPEMYRLRFKPDAFDVIEEFLSMTIGEKPPAFISPGDRNRLEAAYILREWPPGDSRQILFMNRMHPDDCVTERGYFAEVIAPGLELLRF